MRTITVYSKHIYKTKASAWRAARNAVGNSYEVTEPEFQSNFEEKITVSNEMLSVEACEGGWRWAYTYNLANVETWVIRDGRKIDCRYADVAHWKDCRTPPAEAQDNPVRELARRIAEYHHEINNATDQESRSRIANALPRLREECKKAGLNSADIFELCRTIDYALESTDPGYIAEIVVQAEPYGLVSEALRANLEKWSRRRSLDPDVCLEVARNQPTRQAA